MRLRVEYSCWTGLYTIQEWKNLQWVPIADFDRTAAKRLRDELDEMLSVWAEDDE